jgi:nuclear pore complex protein Nup93
LLARGNVDALGLGRDIAHIDTTSTFQPLQPLADDDVQGYLRHVHEQTLISTIEESRKETQAEFYRVMEERLHRDWEDEKKKIFEELGGRTFSLAESSSTASFSQSTIALPRHQPEPSLVPRGIVHSKMMAYDKVIVDLNNARLKDASFPIVNVLKQTALQLNTDVRLWHMISACKT